MVEAIISEANIARELWSPVLIAADWKCSETTDRKSTAACVIFMKAASLTFRVGSVCLVGSFPWPRGPDMAMKKEMKAGRKKRYWYLDVKMKIV